ncbi:MAG: thioredoxin family protein, partial [Halothiobacillaceae bacterium]
MLGTGCKKCTNTAEAIEQVARELDQDIEVTKITDPASIMAYQAMSTPAAVLDGQIVHRGTMPDRERSSAGCNPEPPRPARARLGHRDAQPGTLRKLCTNSR